MASLQCSGPCLPQWQLLAAAGAAGSRAAGAGLPRARLRRGGPGGGALRRAPSAQHRVYYHISQACSGHIRDSPDHRFWMAGGRGYKATSLFGPRSTTCWKGSVAAHNMHRSSMACKLKLERPHPFCLQSGLTRSWLTSTTAYQLLLSVSQTLYRCGHQRCLQQHDWCQALNCRHSHSVLWQRVL